MDNHCTVLLVENNPDDARLAELAFDKAKLPQRLVVLTDSLEALDYLSGKGSYSDRRQFPLPKLVLLDLSMPGLDGFDLLGRIRREPGLRNLPVTVLSGSQHLRDVTRAYQLGANSFLVKPLDFLGFTAAIKEAVDFWLAPGGVIRVPLYLQLPPPDAAVNPQGV
jgi:two-component system, response regulator